MRVWNKLTKASKLTFVIWSVYALIGILISHNALKPYQWIIIWVFGIFLFMLPVQGISALSKKRHSNHTFTKPESIVVQPEPAPKVAVSLAKPQNVTKSTPNYDQMEGHEFEYFCADLLEKNGYVNVKVTQGSGDQGIDVLAEKEGVQYGIQCKCYSSDIGNKAVQEAFSGKTFYGCHVAAVLTNQHFTKSATELAQVNKVLLWDREKLDSFIKNAK